MSMTSLAARPSTEVEPTCSTSSATEPSDARIFAATVSKRRGHSGWYATTATVSGGGGPFSHGFSDGAESSCRVISSFVGTHTNVVAVLGGVVEHRREVVVFEPRG